MRQIWLMMLTAFGVQAGWAQEVLRLDFTQLNLKNTEPAVHAKTRHFPPQPTRFTQSIEVELVSIDKSAYTVGDSVTYEVKLRNVSRVPVELPIKPCCDGIADFAFNDADFVIATLDLGFITQPKTYNYSRAAAVELFGSPLLPDSFLTLAPNQYVRIKAKGKIDPGRFVLSRMPSEQAPMSVAAGLQVEKWAFIDDEGERKVSRLHWNPFAHASDPVTITLTKSPAAQSR